MLKSNFSIYFARFCRHLILVKEWKDVITYLDLSHSFRCLIDVKRDIDQILSQEGYKCEFDHIVNRRKLKKNSVGGISLFDDVRTEAGTFRQFNFINENIETDALLDVNYIKVQEQAKSMSFTEWLSCEFASVKDSENKVIPISREDLLKRIANKFGGSHPYESEFNLNDDKNKELVYRYIDWLQCISLPTVKYGFLLVEEMADDLAMALVDFFLNDPGNKERNIFERCKGLLIQKDKA